jgi:hypothetical protein
VALKVVLGDRLAQFGARPPEVLGDRAAHQLGEAPRVALDDLAERVADGLFDVVARGQPVRRGHGVAEVSVVAGGLEVGGGVEGGEHGLALHEVVALDPAYRRLVGVVVLNVQDDVARVERRAPLAHLFVGAEDVGAAHAPRRVPLDGLHHGADLRINRARALAVVDGDHVVRLRHDRAVDGDAYAVEAGDVGQPRDADSPRDVPDALESILGRDDAVDALSVNFG